LKNGGKTMPEIMTTKELAAYLRLHEVTIQRYAADGVIPSIRIGRSWRFSKEEIDKWLAGNLKNEIGSIDKKVWEGLKTDGAE